MQGDKRDKDSQQNVKALFMFLSTNRETTMAKLSDLTFSLGPYENLTTKLFMIGTNNWLARFSLYPDIAIMNLSGKFRESFRKVTVKFLQNFHNIDFMHPRSNKLLRGLLWLWMDLELTNQTPILYLAKQ